MPISKTEAIKLSNELTALGVKALAKETDGCIRYEDGTYGPVFVTYRVEAVLRDDKHGNTIVRTLTEVCDATKVVSEMVKEMKSRAKATRARIKAERAAS